MQGSLLVQNSNCGCATTRQNWDPLTEQFMKALSAAIGYNPQIGNILNQIVALARNGDSNTTFLGKDFEVVRYKVGTAEDSFVPFNKTFFNGVTLIQDDALIGWDITSLRVGAVPVNPETSGYYYDKTIGQLAFAYPISDTNIWLIKYKTPDAGASGGSLEVQLDGSEISNDGATVTLDALAGRTVKVLILDGGGSAQTYLTGFTKLPDDNYITFTNGATFLAGDKLAFL